MEKVFLLIVTLKKPNQRNASDVSEEMRELVYSSKGNIIDSMACVIDHPTPSYFIRKGKLAELQDRIHMQPVKTIITNLDLSPVQTRNLEQFLKVKIVDRTGLILDIFAQHAKSKDGKLQVELAQLTYILPRLSTIWEKFSRLGGGIGTRGPGEQMLEYDRRKIGKRIATLNRELKKLRTHRALLRKSRKRKDFPIVSIVGYTNAGKSTLLKTLTGSDVLIQDKLFATLDPKTRKYRLSGGKNILFTDTVGFILNLPPNLIKAFHATLEEIAESDIIVNVLDISNIQHPAHNKAVLNILRDLSITSIPIITALNKYDAVKEEDLSVIRAVYPDGLLISAKTGYGLKALVNTIERSI